MLRSRQSRRPVSCRARLTGVDRRPNCRPPPSDVVGVVASVPRRRRLGRARGPVRPRRRPRGAPRRAIRRGGPARRMSATRRQPGSGVGTARAGCSPPLGPAGPGRRRPNHVGAAPPQGRGDQDPSAGPSEGPTITPTTRAVARLTVRTTPRRAGGPNPTPGRNLGASAGPRSGCRRRRANRAERRRAATRTRRSPARPHGLLRGEGEGHGHGPASVRSNEPGVAETVEHLR